MKNIKIKKIELKKLYIVINYLMYQSKNDIIIK